MSEERVDRDRRRLRDGSCISREKNGDFVGYQRRGNSGRGHGGNRDK